MKAIAINLALVAGMLTLGGCRNGDLAVGSALPDLSTMTGFGADAADLPDRPIPAEPGPPLLVGFQAIRVAIPYAGDSGVSKTYISDDGVTIAMNNGFVARVIGLGIDLNAAYLPKDSPWFGGLIRAAKAGASEDRIYEYWEKRVIKRDKFRCTLEMQDRPGGGAIIDETCKLYFEPDSFTNRYWVTSDDQIECSRQRVHPIIPPLQFFRTEQQAATLDLIEQGC